MFFRWIGYLTTSQHMLLLKRKWILEMVGRKIIKSCFINIYIFLFFRVIKTEEINMLFYKCTFLQERRDEKRNTITQCTHTPSLTLLSRDLKSCKSIKIYISKIWPKTILFLSYMNKKRDKKISKNIVQFSSEIVF